MLSTLPEAASPSSARQNDSSEVLIRVENVGKVFCGNLKKSLVYGVQDSVREMLPWLKPRQMDDQGLPVLRPGEFWANRGISFELRRGECLGLIGRNGAGKTTLLKMLNGLIKPDVGSIEMRGRVGALIALGAGFNPVLTGRENVYANGSILGLSKSEIDEKIEEIIDFAEIGDFINSPVQSYSSGMQVRLGFAVATALHPDVLILDEVLAVGDASFRNKCYQRISAIQKTASVIFVSHNMQQVARICDKILVLSKGQKVYLGDKDDGVRCYEELNSNDKSEEHFLKFEAPFSDLSITSETTALKSGDPFELNIRYEASTLLKSPTIRLMFYNASSGFAADATFRSEEFQITLSPGRGTWTLGIPYLPLKNGAYKLGVTIIGDNGSIIAWSYKQIEIQVRDACPLALADCHLTHVSWNSSPRP